ncbi:lactonase [Staphylococcus auricularis]|uniref:SMP-30/gluconolactonase/LRE family protein n=1 Tax=Staphylococcus auricularis TaxID=29379 RepID=UPI00124406D6|nr:SMP-30/gluconolactonase/LRE family protein [Staphylococcus auricularis]MBM0868348.1 SMP-30/gluconolactonase/LRE family protein [Staphylococcus auricularis]MCG7342030.1 SMP-30/gluconolactonase/LRE family protein [Staphylococcus auricularis]
MTEEAKPALSYDKVKSVVPFANGEDQIQTVTAEPWLKIADEGVQLEGLCFDREENLYLCEVFGGKIYRVDLPEKTVSNVFTSTKEKPASVKIHKDGRLFISYLGDFKSSGGIYAVKPDGSAFDDIISDINTEYCVDDLVFDSKGGFYFTDFRGYSTNPIGGVYYVDPDYQSVTPVIQNIAVANGVALSKDERVLWVTETNANRLHRIELEDDGVTVAPFGASIPYRFTGHDGPDSCCIDDDDNLYVAMYQQGRVMVFNDRGNPIGQILIPGRDEGHMLRSTHPAFIPGTNQLIICSNDMDNDGDSWLFTAQGFGKAHNSYQFH